MPLKLNYPCRLMGCPNLVRGGGYCDEHKPIDQQHQHQNNKRRYERDHEALIRQKFYQCSTWKHMRKKILKEHPICQMTGCLHPSCEVDHIIAIQDGGSKLNRSNLQALCKSCHSSKTSREVALRTKQGKE